MAKNQQKKQFLQGNEAIVLGALKVGANFFAGYPITPANEIMTEWIKKSPFYPPFIKGDRGGFIQSEDEIAAIHQVIGASMAGGKVFTATSGPGFSLMQEGIGFAYVTQTPLVIVNCQRQGPSTGMPTVAGQGDILQTQYGTHGDHMAIVFYPYSAEECYKYAIEAFNAAEESLSPVVLLTDTSISHLTETLLRQDFGGQGRPKRIKRALSKGIGHLTGLVNVNGKLLTKDPEAYAKWLANIQNTILKASKNYNFYEYVGNKKSDTLIIAFGAVARYLSEKKYLDKYALFRPIRLFPVLEKEIKKAAANYKKIIVAEMNEGQYLLAIKSILRDKEVMGLAVRGGNFNNIATKYEKIRIYEK